MAESTIRNINPYNNTLTFSDTWVTGFCVAGNSVHVYLFLPYPNSTVSSYNITVKVFVNNAWINCTVTSVGTNVHGIDIILKFDGSASHYGKALLFSINGTIILA